MGQIAASDDSGFPFAANKRTKGLQKLAKERVFYNELSEAFNSAHNSRAVGETAT